MQYSKEKIEELQHRWTTAKGKKLIKIIKDSRCYLSPVIFREEVRNFPGINDTEVDECIDLRGINLSGFDFRVPIKEDSEDFAEEIAIISNIHFEGAILKYCNFQDGKIHNCFFENSDLLHTEFKNAKINECNFQESNCTGMNLHGAKLINCNFDGANIKDVTMDTTIVDQRSTFGNELKSEKEERYHIASIEYKQIKEMYKNSSLHGLADYYHYKEMVAKRKIYTKKNPLYWLNFIFGDLLCKYGTSFVRVLIWSFIVIFLCSFLFTINHSLMYHNDVVKASFLDSLYFSIVSFTTLGYGDYHAVDGMRYVAAVESFLGAALVSLFTVIVARNIIRD